ncbi:phenylalanine--tRNA ligase subunit beta [Vallitalea guaymasensis]|uniref:Phenylalanine--tRNA ligase beta subunit n=1 Tax=Vallitalea guaymasensis TaxID=1185412 RepID=A0A8J8MCY2_9FIRM|nr:phenylalanine--tRNA ligase subunit beta [Vallitalea guaymasensis]QUH30749.1 phenylalanine--tRNA ligase subunit beta [Vallitalea guaymasensis]
MNVPMQWLNDYVEIDCDIDTFMDGMTMSGSKVEGYEELGKEISKVVVGKILKIEKHPDADKLVVTQVNVGEEEPIQIVTGANNISEGDYVPIALVGSTLPDDIKIKKGKLRGIPSNGMMCSVEELGLMREDFPEAPEHGIYIFDKEYELGMDVKSIFGLDDIVVEYEITSNRPDCFSIVGIGREAAATFGKDFKYPEIKVDEVEGNANDYIKIEIEDEDLCARFAGRVVKNLKIEPSPWWLKKRLLSCGVRPINNIVDITNFVMMEFGQPMHAYDLDKLEGKKVIARRAKDNEKIITLDGEERELDSSMLVIADENKPVSLAGIMGGEDTKVTEETKTLLFEAANFEGTNVRFTSKKVGLRSDSSAKFEKYLDPNNIDEAINRACQLINMLGAGEVVSGMVDVYKAKRVEKEVAFTAEGINKLLGTDLSEYAMIKIFEKVDLKVDKNKGVVIVPTFRPDVEREADLAEEVARFYGYDNIPVTLATGTPTVGKKSYKQKIEDITRVVMENCGISEAMTYSFESPKVFDKIRLDVDDSLRKTVTISNPLGEDFSVMRTTTVNGMLTALSTNYNRRNESASLYELSYIYLPKDEEIKELPDERMQLTIGMYGDIDFYNVKGVVETLLNRLGIYEGYEYDPNVSINYLHPGRQAKITINKKELGIIGEVHPEVADNYNIDTRAYLAVIDMPVLVKKSNLEREYEPLAKYPAVNRDLGLLAKNEVLVGQIEAIIKQRGGKILKDIKLFDVYTGSQIEEGYKSLAFALTFRANDHTLKEKEISKTMSKILNGLENTLDVKLRQ